MKKIGLFLFFAGIILLSSCGSDKGDGSAGGDSTKVSGQISISGAFALYPLAVKWAEEFQKIYPDVRIDVQAGGAGKGIADALANQVNLGMVSRDISDAEIKQGAWFIPVTKDAVIPTINSNNPHYKAIAQKGVTQKTFTQLWIDGKPLTWADLSGQGPKDPIKLYKRSDAAGAAESWAKYMGKKQDDLKGVGVFGDPGLAEAVKKDIYGAGFNNVIYVYDHGTKKPVDGLRVIPIDKNENGKIDAEENVYDSMDTLNAAIADGRYPSPPARELFFVSKGKPQDKATVMFLNWVLNDGQKYIKESGFILLPNEAITEAKSKLK